MDDILPLSFLKKSEFTGSHAGMRYRLERVSVPEGDESGEERSGDYLQCTIWPEPFNFHTTPDGEKESSRFSFDEDGIGDAVSWMNDRLFAEREKFESASGRWDSYVLPKSH